MTVPQPTGAAAAELASRHAPAAAQPSASRTSANAALRDWGRTAPDRPLALVGGRTYSYREILDAVEAFAAGLRNRGVQRGDRVAIVADTCVEYLTAWFGINLMSAVDVPVNTNLRGESLAHVLVDAEPSAVICGPGYLPGVTALLPRLPDLRLVLLIGDGGSGEPVVPFQAIPVEPDAPSTLPDPGSLATIMYTSGTTGPPKGVMLPQGYYPWYGTIAAELAAMGPGERMFCCQPLHHIDGRLAVLCAVHSGGSVVLASRFSATRFWADIRSAQATRFFYVGSMLWMLHKQPVTPGDSSQPARIGLGSSTPGEIHRSFEARFGTGLIDTFGMTEGGLLTGAFVGEAPPGTMGKPLASVEMALLDADDATVRPGVAGQIAFRPREPHVIPLGYWKQHEATVQTWRNLWFHTGDLAREDEQGFLTYVGRLKDAIRRRGENISAWQVEQAFLRLEDVAEAAAIGVPSAVGEEDVAVLIVLRPGRKPTAADLCDLITRDSPRYLVPRYIEFVNELPKTASHRVAKATVRARGLSSTAWDAVAAGWRPLADRPRRDSP